MQTAEDRRKGQVSQLLLALQFGLQPLIARRLQREDALKTVIVFTTELIKCVLAVAMLALESTAERRRAWSTWSMRSSLECAAIPALFFSVQVRVGFRGLGALSTPRSSRRAGRRAEPWRRRFHEGARCLKRCPRFSTDPPRLHACASLSSLRQNWLIQQGCLHLDSMTFNLLNQTKTLSAAISCYLLLGRKQARAALRCRRLQCCDAVGQSVVQVLLVTL